MRMMLCIEKKKKEEREKSVINGHHYYIIIITIIHNTFRPGVAGADQPCSLIHYLHLSQSLIEAK